MNRVNSDDCQQCVDNANDAETVRILDDLAAVCREHDRSRPGPANGQAIRDDIFAELDAITAGFAVTCDTPADVVEALSLEMQEALADFDLSGDDPPREESPAIEAARKRKASPEAEALRADNVARGHAAQAIAEIEAWRKGVGREDYNRAKNAAYADMIRETEGREVRPYTRHDTDDARTLAKQQQDKAAQKKRRASMTPEQKKAESEKKAARRKLAKEREAQALRDRALF